MSAMGKEKTIGKLKFSKDNVIGSSNGTTIFKGKYENAIDVAVKRVLIEGATVEINILREAHVHPNIVTYYTTESDDDFNYIATELCRDTLENLIKGRYEGENVGSKLEILKQITEGLNHLHAKDIVHRDIKPQNILISYRDGSVPPKMKLTDFGISRMHIDDRSDLTKTGSSGTLGWIAPEFYDVAVERYSKQSDIFPLGCVFAYVLSDGKHPFGDEKDLRQGNIKKGEWKLPEELRKISHAVELITAMLHSDPNQRPNVKQVLKHSFFDGVGNGNGTTNSSTESPGKPPKVSELFKLTQGDSLLLGRGSFSTTVYKKMYNGNERAIKIIEKEFNDNYESEIEILSGELGNQNIVRYFHHEEDSKYCYIIMELCDLSLTQCINDQRPEFESQGSANSLLKQIGMGLECVHQIGIVHRDLKPSNVLVVLPRPATGNKIILKLADFGISKKLEVGEKDVTERRRGSTGWMAPELFASPAEYTKAVDIFAAGLVLFYAATGGNHPFAPENPTRAEVGSKFNFDACQENIKMNKPSNWKSKEAHSSTFNDLIQWMVNANFVDRPSVSEVLQHPYFWSAEDSLNFIRTVSEQTEVVNKKANPRPRILSLLESKRKSIFTSNWRSFLTNEVSKHLDHKREKYPYDGDSVVDLIRVIRNKYAHYKTRTAEEKEEFGFIPEEYWNYWSTKFPNLLIVTWHTWKTFLSSSESEVEPMKDLVEDNPNDAEMGPSARQRLDSETSSSSSSSSSEDPNQVTTASSASTSESKMDSVVMSLKALALEPGPSEILEPLPIWDIAWNPINRTLLASVSLDAITNLWDAFAISPGNTTFHPPKGTSVSRKSLLAVTWRNNGNAMVTGNSVGDLVFWNVDGTQLLVLPNAMESYVRRLEFHPMKDYLLGTTSNKIMIWSNPLSENETPLEWNDRFKAITYASFNKRELLVAICGLSTNGGFAVNVVKIGRNRSLILQDAIYSAHEGKINEIKWQLGGGKLLATCSADRSVKIWVEGREVHRLEKHRSPVTTIEWRPIHFTFLASASVDGTILIWDTSEGTCVNSLERAHQQTIKSLAFSPDGNTLASGGYDKIIHVWKFETTDQIQRIQSTETGCRINKLYWNCDGSKLAAALNNGNVGFY